MAKVSNSLSSSSYSDDSMSKPSPALMAPVQKPIAKDYEFQEEEEGGASGQRPYFQDFQDTWRI